MGDHLALQNYGRDAVPDLRAEMIDVHVDARADVIDQPFYTAERFGERLDAYAKDPTFSLVAARIADTLVGYAFGGTLTARTRWWTGLRNASDPEVTREHEGRTFAFREIVVRRGHQRHGYAHQLHDALLRDRPEERATLLVRVDNPARDLYVRWGWTVAGTMRPFPDSPVMEAMVRPLR